MKRGFSLVITILLMLSMMTFGTRFARADETVYTEGYFYYTIEDGSITITGYFGDETIVKVPNNIAGIPVNAIASGAFEGTTVEVLYLPDTIMHIGEGGTGSARVIYEGSENPSATTQPSDGAQTSQQPNVSGGNVEDEDARYDDEETVDGDLDSKESVTPAPTEAPTEVPATEAPKATDAPKVAEVKATDAPVKTEPVATAEPAPAEEGRGSGWIWGVGGAAAVITGAAVLVKKRRKA